MREQKIIEVKVIPWSGDLYGVALMFDRGRRSAVLIGSKAEAERIAHAALGHGEELLASLQAEAQAIENRRFRIVDLA